MGGSVHLDESLNLWKILYQILICLVRGSSRVSCHDALPKVLLHFFMAMPWSCTGQGGREGR